MDSQGNEIVLLDLLSLFLASLGARKLLPHMWKDLPENMNGTLEAGCNVR